MNKKNILFITPICPSSPDSGGLQVTLDRLCALVSIYNVTVIAIAGNEESKYFLLNTIGVKSVYYGNSNRNRNIKNFIISILLRKPLSVWRNMDFSFLSKSSAVFGEIFDILYIDHWIMWPLSTLIKNYKYKVLHLHNAEHRVFYTAALSACFIKKLILIFESKRVEKYLLKICTQVDELHFLSSSDRDNVLKLGCINSKCSVFLPTVKSIFDNDGAFNGDILFIGTMSWFPNEQGVRWFLSSVLPFVNTKKNINIIGGNLNVDESLSDNVNILGRVPDLDFFYKNAFVFIAPLLSGSGIKIKIINALSHGIPVVTTSVGVEGFPDDWGDAIFVSDDPIQFARYILTLEKNKALWVKSKSDAIKYASKYFYSDCFLGWVSSHE